MQSPMGSAPAMQAHARATRAGDARARRLAALRSPAGLIAGFAGLFYAAFIARTAFTADGRTYFTLFDDAMVSMRFGRNLAEGGGLVWNPGGEHVEGYTNLLWTLWMALVHLAGAGDAKASLVVMASGAAILVANLFVVRAVVREIAPERGGAALAAMAATALYYPLVYWTLRGMEVGLVALLTSLMALYALRLARGFDARTLAKLAAVMALGVLTRDDVVVPCLVVGAYVVLRCPGVRVRGAAVLGGALFVAIGGHEAFRWVYYDSLLPNTYELKMGGVAIGERLARGGTVLANVTWGWLYLPLALAAAALVARRRGVGLLVAVFGAQAAYSVYVGGDAWEFLAATNRFITPAVPLLLAAAAIGFAALVESRPRRGAALAALAVAPVAVVHLLGGLAGSAVLKLPDIPGGGGFGARQELAAAMGAGLLAAAVALAVSASGGASRRWVWPAFALALVVATSGIHLQEWPRQNAAYADADADMARYGLGVRDATSPETTVAVAWAGAIPYFDRRPSIDLLGKSDRTIAAGEPRDVPFHPGHVKWNYAHSVGRLRPDVVAQLWRTSAADRALLRRAGYAEIAARVHVRSGARDVRIDALRGAVPPR